uniref:Tryptophan synthase alpha chain n=1 Tax=Platysiphonia delicata TaxID=2006979 RepID=A0A1Z1M0W3_9FLOR|nr:Tryptophan synthase alpha subunit [Platysiphonia delicata]ARW59530.1 Tryptophan synthase alpha subunit [Platysiphonia delicata]
MNTISKVLRNKKNSSICALIPFITAGYPNINTTIKALYALDKSGADIIELGIPYVDALADGPIIQNSSQIAIEQGVFIDDVLSILSAVTVNLTSPVIVFTYYNPILVRGLKLFIGEISKSGAKGLIIPDLPIEETNYLIYLCSSYNIELILFISPTSSIERISYILSKAPGCLYLVGNTGVTGPRESINYDLVNLCNFLKSKSNKSVIIGFGISSNEQVSELSRWNIDGVVMGSVFVNILSDHDACVSISSKIGKLSSFCKKIRCTMDTTY